MNAQYLRLVLANGDEMRLTDSLTSGKLYVQTADGEFVQVTSARVMTGVRMQGKTCINPDGTVVEYDAEDHIERIIPPQQPWLKAGDSA
jgi:hypothetical protein